MNEVDEILGTNNNSYSTNIKANNYKSKKQNTWREQQNKDRQEIYDTMDRMAKIVGKDNQKFQEYLNIQSKFAKYSVGNCLVILEKAPKSTQIKDQQAWLDKGIDLIENPQHIMILKSVKSNGTIYYNPKKVYDISQTNSPKQEDNINYNARAILEALLHECPVPRKAVEILPNGEIGSEYNQKDNILYVCKNMDIETLFKTFYQEMAKIEMKDELDGNMKNFKSYCISYMLCKRYGIDVSSFNFPNLPQEITELNEPVDIRRAIGEIRDKFETINDRMSDYFEMKKEEKKKSTPER